MYLTNKYNNLFIHIPKSGGTAIATSLLKSCGDNVFRSSLGGTKHLTIMQVKDYMDKTGNGNWFNLKNYTKCAFVRNPWDRMVSGFFYLKQNEKRPELQDITFNDYMATINTKYPTKTHKFIMKTQKSYIVNNKDKVAVDFVGRYENLEADYAKMCALCNIPNPILQKKNSSKHKPYQEYYNETSRKIVEEIFAEDIAYFNYKF